MLCVMLLPTVAGGQPPAAPPADRTAHIETAIARTETLIAEKRWLDAAVSFDAVWKQLHEGEDVLPALRFTGAERLEPGTCRNPAGARARLRRLFRSAPAELVREYRRQFGPQAVQAFRTALTRQDIQAVRSLVLRYEHCSESAAGLAWLIQSAHARGRSAEEALLWMHLLQRPDMATDARQASFAQSWQRAGFPSNAFPFPTDRLPKPRAHSSRVRLRPGGSTPHAAPPVFPRQIWSQTLFQSPGQTGLSDGLAALESVSAGQTAHAPSAQPLLTDRLVIGQGAGSLLAFDRRTGHVVWESSRFERTLRLLLSPAARQSSSGVSLNNMVGALLADAARSNTRGQLVSDGRHLFCIEETTGNWTASGSPNGEARPFNVLRAYDIDTGRLLGEAGGPAGRDVGNSDPLTSIWFLGAPLILDGQLHLSGEDEQGIHLLRLRLTPDGQRDSGRIRFEVTGRQMLSVPDYPLATHPLRRYAGLMPVLGGGRIICQDGSEHVFAIDPVDLSVEWIHRYHGNIRPAQPGTAPEAIVASAISQAESDRLDRRHRPHDSLPRVAGNRILIMPRDSDQVICLEASTGRSLWSRPRDQLRYFAGISEQQAVLAGPRQVLAVRTDTGEPLWHRDFTDLTVSGQPAWTDRLVCLPTQNGELAILSRNSGRLLLRQQLSDEPLGHLTIVDGLIIARSTGRLTAWTGTTGDRTNPLARVYELLLNEETDAAVTELRQLLQQDTPERSTARTLLTETLLESLRQDFFANRHTIPFLKQLLQEARLAPDQAAELLHHSVGMTPPDIQNWRPLWKPLQRVPELENRLHQLILHSLLDDADLSPQDLSEQIIHFLNVTAADINRQQRSGRGIRLAAVHVATVIHTALDRLEPSERQEVLRRTDAAVRDILASASDPVARIRHLEFCRMAGLESDWWLSEAVSGLPDAVRPALETCLFAARRTDLPADAVPDSVRHLEPSGDPDLLRRWPSIRSDAGGPGNDPVGRLVDYLEHRTPRPHRNQPHIADITARSSAVDRHPLEGGVRSVIPLYGMPGAYRGWQFVRLHHRTGISAVDPRGRVRWSFDPDGTTDTHLSASGFRRQQSDYAVACGRLIGLVENGRLYVLDGFSAGLNGPAVLWSMDLDHILPPATQHQMHIQIWERTEMYDRQPDGLAPIGPLTEYGFPLFRGHRLVVVSPWSGSILWAEDGLPDDTRLAADGTVLCLLAESTGQIQVRDLRDGTLRTSGILPDWWTEGNLLYDTPIDHIDLEEGTEFPWRICMEGTRCLLFTISPSAAWLKSCDFSQFEPNGDPVVGWQVKLSAETVFSSISDGHVAVLSDGRRLQIRRIADGSLLTDTQVPPAPDCERLYLRHSAGRFIVLSWCPDPHEPAEPVIGTVPLRGPLYAVDDRTGQIAWTDHCDNEAIRILNADRSPTPPAGPLLILLKRHVTPLLPGVPRVSRYAARILDARDGHLLWQRDDVGRTLSYHGLTYTDDHRFIVHFDAGQVTIDYSVPPE